MENIKSRLGRLESLAARTPPPPRGHPGRVTLAEIRALEKHIKRLESGAAPTSPADVARSVEPGGELAAVLRKIEWLEELERASEGRTRWT